MAICSCSGLTRLLTDIASPGCKTVGYTIAFDIGSRINSLIFMITGCIAIITFADFTVVIPLMTSGINFNLSFGIGNSIIIKCHGLLASYTAAVSFIAVSSTGCLELINPLNRTIGTRFCGMSALCISSTVLTLTILTPYMIQCRNSNLFNCSFSKRIFCNIGKENIFTSNACIVLLITSLCTSCSLRILIS